MKNALVTKTVKQDSSKASPEGQYHLASWNTLYDAWLLPWKTLFPINAPCPSPTNEPVPAEVVCEIEPPSTFDRVVHANMARLTLGISPASLALAYTDWAVHLAVSPEKLTRLVIKSMRKATRLANYFPYAIQNTNSTHCIQPLPQDQRFKEDGWKRWPFNFYAQAFLLQQQWWHNATTGIEGVSPHSENVVSFMARQILDMLSPVNFGMTNPVVLEATLKEAGFNLLRGLNNLKEDIAYATSGRAPAGVNTFIPGKHVAISPGKVVFRNQLIELIQYAPTTDKVNAEPLLIVPAWIMKYYILDLSPENSLVRYLVSQGHTVFIISWHNPTANDRNLGMDDYLRMGVLEALTAIQAIVPGKKIHAAGYCLGGTLLAIAAAYLAAENNTIIHSMTLLAAQTDFTESGELMLFIDHSQLSYLDDMMWDKGYLDTKQTAAAFQLLRSNDLIWSPLVQQYMLGERLSMNDLMAWNSDATRMPYRMHSDYLRSLFLNNDLFEGRYHIAGKPIALSNIRVPIFAVATEKDHVAPWRSVYKIKLATDVEVTFVLTTGGHNAGIVSEPGHAGRHFHYGTGTQEDNYIDPDKWIASSAQQEGSWWPMFSDWLTGLASAKVDPPTMGAAKAGYPPMEDAPGEYIKET